MGTAGGLCLAVLCAAAAWIWVRALTARGRSRRGPVAILCGLGILAFLFSVLSPDDDLVQQEVLAPSAHSLSENRHPQSVPGGSIGRPLVAALRAQAYPVLPVRGAAIGAVTEELHPSALPVAPVSIHSPPLSL